jgi:hypothetical protein
MLGDGGIFSYLLKVYEVAHVQFNVTKFNLTFTCFIIIYVFSNNIPANLLCSVVHKLDDYIVGNKS